MKVKKISCFYGQTGCDYIKVTNENGEIVYIAIGAIISITVQTNKDIVIKCLQNESYLLQGVSNEQLEELLRYGEEYEDNEAGDNDLEI